MLSTMYFEPENPIVKPSQLTSELLDWSEREGNDLVILREGMEPEVRLDGKRYHCMLEQPRMLNTKSKVATALSFMAKTYGYKWVYLHEIEE